MLLHMKIRMLSKNRILRFCTRTLLWKPVGRSFYIARPNYVVTDYHIELLQMKTLLKLANLSISDYSCTFDDSYSLLKSDATDHNLQFFLFESL
jgi:hypothetical protein